MTHIELDRISRYSDFKFLYYRFWFLDPSVCSHLTRQKLAALIGEIALLDWPTQWQSLFDSFLWKARQRPIDTSSVFLSVLQQLSDASQQAAVSPLPIKRRREILQALEVSSKFIYLGLSQIL